MKKFIGLSLIVLAALFLVMACNGDDDDDAAMDEGSYEDGSYMAAYTYTDNHEWKPYLKITVENGNISSATFDYVNAQGQLKTEDEGYRERMEPIAGTYPEEFTQALEERLIEEQDAPVDAVSGATSSSKWFNNLADELLEQAEEGEMDDLILPMNETYTAEDEADERGWIGHIEITFEDGEMVDVEYDEVKKEGRKIIARKTEDEDYAERWEEKSDITPEEAYDELAERLLTADVPSEVDAVTGATGTSSRFIKLAEQALAKRQEATVPE